MANTFTTFTEDAPATTTFAEHPAAPDITTQDSNSYAGAVTNQKIQSLAQAAPTALPTVKDMQEMFDRAYSEAEAFKKGQAEANLAQARQQQQKIWELTAPQQGGLSPIQVEAAERAQIEQQQKQKYEGPSAAAASAAQGGAFIQKEAPAYGDKISAGVLDLDGLQRLYKLHDQMTDTAPFETGGTLRSWLGHSKEAAIATDANAKNYFALADLLQTSFGKGIQGDLPAATTKQNIVEMMQNGIVPGVEDNPVSAHNKFFNLYNQGMMMMKNLRAQMATEGQDTTRIDKALADYGPWLDQHKNDDPVRGGGNPIVQQGISAQSNQIINAQVNAAIGAQQGQAGQVRQAAAPVQPTAPTQVAPAPNAYGAAVQTAGQYAGGPTVWTPQNMPTVSAEQLHQLLNPPTQPTLFQTIPQAVGQTVNWLGSQLPENQFSAGMPPRQF